VYTVIRTFRTGSPDRRAASTFPPTAYMDRPMTVRLRMNQQITPASAIITIGMGSPGTPVPNRY